MPFGSGALPRFLLVYAALYAGYGLTTPFLPALLAERGLSSTEVGLVLAAGTGIRLAAGPLAGRIADRRPRCSYLYLPRDVAVAEGAEGFADDTRDGAPQGRHLDFLGR